MIGFALIYSFVTSRPPSTVFVSGAFYFSGSQTFVPLFSKFLKKKIVVVSIFHSHGTVKPLASWAVLMIIGADDFMCKLVVDNTSSFIFIFRKRKRLAENNPYPRADVIF